MWTSVMPSYEVIECFKDSSKSIGNFRWVLNLSQLYLRLTVGYTRSLHMSTNVLTVKNLHFFLLGLAAMRAWSIWYKVQVQGHRGGTYKHFIHVGPLGDQSLFSLSASPSSASGVVYTMDHEVVPRPCKKLWLVVGLVPGPLRFIPRKIMS